MVNLAGGVDGRFVSAFAVDIVAPDVVAGLNAKACPVAGTPTPSTRRHSRVMVSLYITLESLEALVEDVSTADSLEAEGAVAVLASASGAAFVDKAAGRAGP